MNQAKEMARIAFDALEEKKGENTCIIDISEVSILADYFIISDGNSDSQLSALVDNVEEKMHKAGFVPKQSEGRNSGTWVLLDYGDIIVHVFERESREFYHLEHIWSDGKRIENIDEL